VVAWFVRRSAHVISLVLIFNVGMKDGLLHAVYSEYQVLLIYLCDMLRIPIHFHVVKLLFSKFQNVALFMMIVL